MNHIPQSIPPEEMLAMFDAELKHYLSSSRGCLKILYTNPGEEARQRMLSMMSVNIDKLEELSNAIRTYLDQRAK